MSKKNNKNMLIGLLGVLMLAASGVVIYHILTLRFRNSDVYPVYSTLRSDPLGCKVFYESLKHSGLEVSRGYEPIRKLNPPANATIMVIGASSYHPAFSGRTRVSDVYEIDRWVANGGRLVVTYMPRQWLEMSREEDEKEETESGKKEEEQKASGEDNDGNEIEEDDPAFTNISKEITWLGIDFVNVTNKIETNAVLNEAYQGCTNLPSTISCHTHLCFTNLSEEWSVVYRRDQMPVVIERKRGKGSIVLSCVSYILSNEGLKKERHPTLLSWFLKKRGPVIFDEMHHGLYRQRGFMNLVRERGLLWAVFATALVAVFFIWRSGVRLVPSVNTVEVESDNLAEGKGSFEGLANLMRRNISRRDLVKMCVKEWSKGARTAGVFPVGTEEALLELIERHKESSPEALFNHIRKSLSAIRFVGIDAVLSQDSDEKTEKEKT